MMNVRTGGLRVPRALLLFVAGLCLLSSNSVSAQSGAGSPRSPTSGFHIGATLDAVGIDTDRASPESGYGLSLLAGYRLWHRLDVFAQLSGAEIYFSDRGGPPWSAGSTSGEVYSLAHADLGLRLVFGAGKQLAVPFIQLAVAARQLDATSSDGDNVAAVSSGVSYGVGIEISTSYTPLAIAISLVRAEGRFESFRVNGSAFVAEPIPTSTGRLGVGLVWFP